MGGMIVPHSSVVSMFPRIVGDDKPRGLEEAGELAGDQKGSGWRICLLTWTGTFSKIEVSIGPEVADGLGVLASVAMERYCWRTSDGRETEQILTNIPQRRGRSQLRDCSATLSIM